MVTTVSCEVDATGTETAVRRLRTHLHLVTRQGQPAQVRRDMRTIMQRLRGVQARDAAFAGVELGPQVGEMMKTLEIVGNEMLVLDPERKRA